VDATPSTDDAQSPHVRFTAQPDDAWNRHTAAFTYSSPEGWTATGTVTRTRRRGVVISEIAFHARLEEDGAPGAVTSSDLRKAPTGEIVAAAMRSPELPPYEYEQPAPPVSSDDRPRPGRVPITDGQLREIAVLYLEETAPGKPRGAIKRIAERKGMSTPTVGRWVMRAREAGWLGPAVPGREGGEPGARLVITADLTADGEVTPARDANPDDDAR
jgi:hypothetical protein